MIQLKKILTELPYSKGRNLRLLVLNPVPSVYTYIHIGRAHWSVT